MFKRVMKEKGRNIILITLIMSIAMFLSMSLLLWFIVVPESRNLDHFINEMKVPQILTLTLSILTLVGFVLIYEAKKQEIIVSDRIKAFTEKYKVGDQFFAVRRRLTYSPENPSTIFNDVFHLKVEKIDRKNRFIELSDEYRPKWHPRRTGMSDFIIFKNKDSISIWLKGIQNAHKEILEEFNSDIEGFTND